MSLQHEIVNVHKNSFLFFLPICILYWIKNIQNKTNIGFYFISVYNKINAAGSDTVFAENKPEVN
jgi:hypothetical protein